LIPTQRKLCEALQQFPGQSAVNITAVSKEIMDYHILYITATQHLEIGLQSRI
jgi:hypothetical protein